MYDPRNKLTQQVTNELSQHFNGVLYSTVIPRNVKLAEAPSFGKPVLKHEPSAKGALAKAPFALGSCFKTGFPKLGASANFTFLGMTVE